MRKQLVIVAATLAAAGAGVAVALAIGQATQTVCATATATTPPHTIAVDGQSIYTTPGNSGTATQCITVTVGTATVTIPATTTTAPTTAPTTTTTPPGPDPLALIFPRNIGPPGTPLPARGCADPLALVDCVGIEDFNRADYEGWTFDVNDRMSWQPDPGGSGKTVVQFTVLGGDNADQFGGTRTSLWRVADNCSGCTAWQAFGLYIPVGFTWPDTFFLLYQDFSSGGNPAQALELRGAGCVSAAPRDHFCWKDQTAPGSGRNYADLGLVQPGRWFYIAEQIEFLDTSGGSDRVWSSYDALPDVGAPPQVNWSGPTAYTTGPNRTNILEYRDPSSQPPAVVYYCGFHRASSEAALSLPLCPL